jgi:hypothetical protein
MSNIDDARYKTDEKKDFTPQEHEKARIACEFVIELTKAISRSGYYDADHPVSHEVKKGLYDSFKNALGSSSEIMLTSHEFEDKVDIHISGILDEPFNIRKLTQSNTSDLFVPKLKDYFERKSLNSFVIKKEITPEHFESFIDIMSEPVADSTDSSKLGDYLTKALADSDITEVSTVFKNDIVLPRGKLPWRVSIILRRLAKDLKVVPMFRQASADKMKLIKKQIVEDIIRPLNNTDLLKDLIVNSDVIVIHLTDMLEVDEMEQLIIASLPSDEVVTVSESVFNVFKEIQAETDTERDDSTEKERGRYLKKVLDIASKRIISEELPEAADLFEQLYEYEIVDYDSLPEDLRFNIQIRKLAGDIVSQIDDYIEKAENASSIEEMESVVKVFQRVMPELIKRKEWPAINKIIKELCDVSSGDEELTNASELLSNMPDSLFEGSEEILADEYGVADLDSRKEIYEILAQMKTGFINVANSILNKSKDPGVLKSVIDLLSQKGELARQWSIKILEDLSQPISMLNSALLVIVSVGEVKDAAVVRKYVKYVNPSIRTKALAALAKLNKNDDESMIVDALKDEDERVRHQAARLIENELLLSEKSVNRLLIFIKEKLQNKNITDHEAVFLAGLIKAMGRSNHYTSREYLETEIIGIISDLMKEKAGLLKFIKSELGKEQTEIVSACLYTLGKSGGAKARDYLKTFASGNTVLSRAAQDVLTGFTKS